jgi:uncharacterized membrane protein YphA (DoxX/SURF4 family)
MKVLLYIIGACLVVYALQLALVGLTVALGIAVVIGFLTRPREMVAMVFSIIAISLFSRFPGQTVLGVVALSALSWIDAGIRRARLRRHGARMAERQRWKFSQPRRLPPP